MEVDLCGHATLASAHVLFRELGVAGDRVKISGHAVRYLSGEISL